MNKEHFSRSLARYLVNPVVGRVAGFVPWWSLLETTGRKTGRPRRNPVGNGLDGDTFWIVSEHGERAAYVKNIKASPRVRVRVGGRWREGVAHLLYDDDARERQRSMRPVNAALVRLMGTQLLTVRIDLAPLTTDDERKPPGAQVTAAALVAAAVSGIPSTVYAVATGRPLLEATEAAGSLLLPRETRSSRLVPAAGVIHLCLSLFWSRVLAQVLPRRPTVGWGLAAGSAIGVLDLLIIGRRWPLIRELPVAPQMMDHMAFGAVVAVMLRRSKFPDTGSGPAA